MNRIKLAPLGIGILLAGCAAATPPEDGAPPPAETGACDAAPAQSLVGQIASPQLAERAQQLTGAGSVRWLQPGQMVTQEYRADRLNIHLDAQNQVERITCG